MGSLKNISNSLDRFPRVSQGIRIRNNFGRWFLYRTSRYDRYEIDKLALEIIKLCNGADSVNKIISLVVAKNLTDRQSAKRFLDYLGAEKIIEFATHSSPAKEASVYEDIGPSWVVLHVTNRCNLCCRHCYVNAGQGKTDELSFSEICDCIDQLEEMGVVDIIFTGGEPFIRPDFLDIIKYCGKSGISTEILTNGTLIDGEKAGELISANVTQVLLSLDGSEAVIHENLRRVNGCWESAIRGIRNLKRAGISVVTNTVINQQNRFDLKNMPAILADLGVDVWRLGTLFYVGRSRMGNPHLDIPVMEQIRILSELDELYFKQKWPFNLTTTIDWESTAMSGSELADRKHICGMTMGKHWYIRANGNVLVCDRLPKLVIGNLRKQRLKELWQTELVKQWKFRTVDEIKGCQECKWRYLCGGGCRANAKLHTGNFFQRDPIACLTMECSIEQRWNKFPAKIRERLSKWLSVDSKKKGGERICAE